jgi:hypothetical protein
MRLCGVDTSYLGRDDTQVTNNARVIRGRRKRTFQMLQGVIDLATAE